MTPRVALLDPSARTTNLGDHIIVQAVLDHVPELRAVPSVPTHELPDLRTWRTLRTSDVAVFAGTNALAPGLWRARQWPSLTLLNQSLRHKVVYLGVGWGADRPRLDQPTAMLLRRTMRPGMPVGCRDRLTTQRATASGLDAMYTGCPTMWGLAERIPAWSGRREVVTTLTGYRPDLEHDTEMLNELCGSFDRVLLWPQGSRDAEYLRSLTVRGDVTLLADTLSAFDEALAGRAYIGTRLHGGVRALHAGAPILIFSVDHRAESIARDTGLPVVKRGGQSVRSAMNDWMRDDLPGLELPTEQSTQWLRRLRENIWGGSGDLDP